jgi:hypothetical protein
MFRPMRIVFQLDGTGVCFDPAEPIMLDALLASALCRFHVHGEPPARDEEPFDIPLPLQRWKSGSAWGWSASALQPDGDKAESLQYWRKRFRQGRVELAAGAPNLTNGVYRDWNMPMPLLLTHRLVGYAVGDAGRVRRELRRSVRSLGKKRAHGRGRVIGIDVETCEDDFSITRDGIAMRWFPQPDGARLVRPRPPYWNMIGRVQCCEIGERIKL